MSDAPDHGIWMILPLTIAEGQYAAWETFFADMRASVAAEEPGTLRFDLFRVRDRPGRYTMIEHYDDQAAWDAHSRLQMERGVVPQMIAFQAAPPDFQFLEAVGGKLR